MCWTASDAVHSRTSSGTGSFFDLRAGAQLSNRVTRDVPAANKGTEEKVFFSNERRLSE